MRPGVVLQDRYEVVGTLGTGGQATVFAALDRRLGVHVAVKRSLEQRETFVREARRLASLRHPSLPVVSDFWVEPAGDEIGQYLVLELVPGDDLEARVEQQGRPCALDDVLVWTDQLLDALAYLHGQSPPIVHRDVKPRNLKVRPDGRLVLLDFGLAKSRPAQDHERGPLAGMRGYSHGPAPLEQLLSEGTDARGDLYAVGAALYFLLSGKSPRDAIVRDRDRGWRGDPLRPLESLNADVPGLVAGLIHRALELQPDRRFQTAAGMRHAFAEARRTLMAAPAPFDAEDVADEDDLVAVPATDSPEPPTVVPLRPARIAAASVVVGKDVADGDDAVRVDENAERGVAVAPPTPPRSVALASLGTGYQLVVAHGEQPADRWVLAADRPNTIGRGGSSSVLPDVDLWPDRRASREHARLWHADHLWWIEDAGSKHGTRVDGRPLTPGEAAVLRPWSEIEFGDTTLFLAPPGWHRLRTRDLVLDLEVVGAVSSSLVHAGLPIVRRMVTRHRGRMARPAGQVEIALEPCSGPVAVRVPPLDPGASATLTLPPIVPSFDVLEGQAERSRRRLRVTIDGEPLRDDSLVCWLLPHNEWSTLAEHRPALATFVLPNHPAVVALASEVAAAVDPDAPAEVLLAGLFEVLAERWHLTYRLEPPHWAADSQKVRLPHQVLLDDAGRRGDGTCLDLALLAAACLENLGVQPLVAILDLGEWWHALVGCWSLPEATLEPVCLDGQALLDRATWVDPTCVTRDPEIRQPSAQARAEAVRCLRERPLLFALDVAAARRDGVMPLPYAGLPSWSPGVARAIDAANVHARSAAGQLCSAALLAGLLTAGDGLTSDLVGASLGDPAAVARTIVAALPPSPPAIPASPGYRQVLDVARSRAKAAGSPTVLEAHLLGALLALRSTSLEWALGKLGTDQQRLARALDSSPDLRRSLSSGWH